MKYLLYRDADLENGRPTIFYQLYSNYDEAKKGLDDLLASAWKFDKLVQEYTQKCKEFVNKQEWDQSSKSQARATLSDCLRYVMTHDPLYRMMQYQNKNRSEILEFIEANKLPEKVDFYEDRNREYDTHIAELKFK